MTARIRVQAERCISSGLCIGERPDLFRFDEEGISQVYGEIDDATDDLDEVIAQCPVTALHLEED